MFKFKVQRVMPACKKAKALLYSFDDRRGRMRDLSMEINKLETHFHGSVCEAKVLQEAMMSCIGRRDLRAHRSNDGCPLRTFRSFSCFLFFLFAMPL